MTLLLVQGVGSFAGLLIFVWVGSGAKNPLRAVIATLHAAFSSRGGHQAVGAISTVIALNYAEGILDPALSRWIGLDATRVIYAVEGDLVGRLQAATPNALLIPLALIYVPGYLAILTAPLVVWTSAATPRIVGRYVVAFVLNYVAALPFFLFVPVREVGWSGDSTARPLLDSVWPGITAELRAGSPLDNCFPSMHVSCAVTALWFAQRYGPMPLRVLAWLVVPAIAWSTVALGIHWVSDVFSGVIVAVACCLAAERAQSSLK